MKAFFISFGCKVNQYETEGMKSFFEKNGFEITNDSKSADAIIINSCTVTSNGENKVIHALKKLRRNNPGAVIALTGCIPQAFPEKAADLPEADIITGTKIRSSLLELVKKELEQRRRTVCIEKYSGTEDFENLSCTQFRDKTRAFVKIQDGCNQFCSYCIIPYARGRCRSKPINILKHEVMELAASGHREIVLVGINLAFYGSELCIRLPDAVEVCSKVEGVERIRLGSLEPEILTDSDLKRFAALKQFCPHFHLSLQSGCDRTLKAMNRHYSSSEYYDLVCRIRKFFPDASITTDIMVGFPGETEEDFAESMKFVQKVGFAKIHVFPYSIREGTKAAKMKEQIPDDVKYRRAEEMKRLAADCEKNFLESQIGKIYPVLFERERSPEFHQGHTPNYVMVKIPSENCEKSLRRKIFYVKIVESKNDCCIGEIISD